MKRNKIIIGFLIFILITVNSTVMATVEKINSISSEREMKDIGNSCFISVNSNSDIYIPSFLFIKSSNSQEILFDETQTKIIIENNHRNKYNINNNGGGFNPAIDEIIVWFDEYDKECNYIIYFWKVENRGENYTFEDGINCWLRFYGLDSNEEEYLWSSGFRFDSNFTWEAGEYHASFFVIKTNEKWKKPPQIKAVIDIIHPEEFPDANPHDNIMIVPFKDCIKVNSHVQNLSGNPVREAEVMFRILEDHFYWFGIFTNEKGKCTVPVPPRDPLDTPSVYKLYAGKPFDPFNLEVNQNKTTEPLMEGEETNLEFEIDAEGEKSKLRQKFFFLNQFPNLIKLIQRLQFLI